MPKFTYLENGFKANLLAPCGLNCRVCHKYIREKKSCPGCRADDALKPKSKWVCRIKECEMLSRDEIEFCFQCKNYPCEPIKQLNKRYIKQYSVSVIDNLNEIDISGVHDFLEKEAAQWTCHSCGDIASMHKSLCPHCKGERKSKLSNKAL